MSIVIASWGSSGDVLPYIALGAELKRRGYRVRWVGNPYFAGPAGTAGLELMPVGTAADHERMMADSAVFDREGKSPEAFFAEHYYPHLEGFRRTVEEACRSEPSLIVGLELAASAVAERASIPQVAVCVSPATGQGLVLSRSDPPHPQRVLPGWAAWFGRGGRRLAMLHRLNALRRRSRGTRSAAPARLPDQHPIARLRASAGLAPETRSRPALILCLWPEWFAAPQPDWPREAVAVGFPLRAEAVVAAAREPDLIVATTGSVAGSQDAFYATVIAACERLRARAVLVTPHRDHVPAELPPGIRHAAHADFAELFPRASLVIHHGGIGTAAYALAAGTPQISVPMRGDQFDNGNRLVRLGVARMLARERTGAASLALAIETLRTSARTARRCDRFRQLVAGHDGIGRAADEVARLAQARGIVADRTPGGG